MILFDASEEQVCRYAPNETWIGMTAEELEAEATLPTAYRQFWEDRIHG